MSPGVMTAFAFALELARLAPAIKAGVTGAIDALDWGRERLEAMAAEGRDPTPEEWAALNARTQALRDALHSDQR